MKNDTSKKQKEDDKKFPGYTSDKKKGSSGENFPDQNKDPQDSGPVRNPNYHKEMIEKHDGNKPGSPLKHKPGTDGKTLEDFNDAEPNRDVNKVTPKS